MSIGRVPGATGIQPSIVDAKGDLIAATAADSVSRLAVGSNETRLVAASGEATGLKYVADTTNYAIAAKGDLLVGTAADTLQALSVGTNGHTLVADSGETTGLKWAIPNGYTELATGSLTSGTTLSLTSISGDYRVLELWLYGINCAADFQLTYTLNNDTGTSYRTSNSFGTSAAGTANRTNAYWGEVMDASGSAAFRLSIPAYSVASSYRMINVWALGAHPTLAGDLSTVNGIYDLWYNTSAINRVDVTSTENFSSGTYKLYGVK